MLAPCSSIARRVLSTNHGAEMTHFHIMQVAKDDPVWHVQCPTSTSEEMERRRKEELDSQIKDGIQKYLHDALIPFRTKVTDLQGEVAQLLPLQAEVARLHPLEAQVTDLQGEVARLLPLQAEVARLHPLEAQVTDLQGEVARLQPLEAQVTDLHGEVARLQPLEAQVTDLQGEVARLQPLEAEVARLQPLEGEVAQLRPKVAALQGEVQHQERLTLFPLYIRQLLVLAKKKLDPEGSHVPTYSSNIPKRCRDALTEMPGHRLEEGDLHLIFATTPGSLRDLGNVAAHEIPVSKQARAVRATPAGTSEKLTRIFVFVHGITVDSACA